MDAKTSLYKVDKGDKNSPIPDLPTQLVKEIQQYISLPKYEDAVQRIFWYLSENLVYLVEPGAIDKEDPGKKISEKVTIKYEDKKNGKSGETNLAGTEDDAKAQVFIYTDAFFSVEHLYSVIRHELIHAAQRMYVPDEGEASEKDPFMFYDIYGAIGKRTIDSLQLPLEEIETHVWELENSEYTKVDHQYIQATQKDLASYTQAVTKAVESTSKLPKKDYQYWKKYIEKALHLLDSLGNEDGEEVLKARESLRTKVNTRNQ